MVKTIKKLLSLFLVLACIITLLPINVFAQSGGGDSASGGGSASPTGTGIMFRGVAYRIALFNESAGFDSGNMNTIAVDRTNMTVTLRENNAYNLGYGDGSSWYYFTGVDCGEADCVDAGTYKALNMDGSRTDVTVHAKADLEAYIGSFSSIDDLIKEGGNLDNYCDENLESWKTFFGYDTDDPCLLVIEVLYNMTDTYKNNLTLVSRQQLYYAGSSNSKLVHTNDLVKNVYGVNCPDTTNHGGKILKNYIYQTLAPYGYTLNTVGSTAYGYIVYGLEHIVDSKTTASNIVVEYQGEAGTNDSSKYNISSTVVEGSATASTSTYSDLSYWSGSDFTASADRDTYLQLSSGFKSSSEYHIAYTGVLPFNISSDKSVADIKSALNGIDTSKLNINWGDTPVKAADSNGKAVGSKYSVTGISYNGGSYSANVNAIAKAVKAKLGSGATMGSLTDCSLLTLGTGIKDSINYMLGRAMQSSASKNTSSGNDLKANNNMGLGITFVIKSSEVTSNLYTITVGNDVTVKKEATGTYNTADSYSFGLHNGASAYLVVPNDNAVTNASTIKGVLNGVYDSEQVISKLSEACGGANSLSGTTIPTSITCGTKNGKGFTVYQIIIDEQTVEGKVELPAYMLNKYFNNIIQTSSENVGVKNVFKLNANQYAVTGKVTQNCVIENQAYNVGYSSNYTVLYKDISSVGTSVGYDKGSLLGRYFLKSTNAWSEVTRGGLTGNYTVLKNTKGIGTNRVDYAFNFVRSSVGDIRTISGIRYASLETIDTDNVLKVNYGVSPVTIKKATNGIISGDYKETISISGIYQHTGTTKGEQVSSISKHLFHDSGSVIAGNYSYCDGFDVYTFKEGNVYPFVMNSSKKQVLTYTFNKTAYKYQANQLGVGKNENLVNGVLGLETGSVKAYQNSSIILNDKNAYKYSFAKANGYNLSFYPEVKMAYKLIGTEYNSSSYYSVYTMGEEKRTVESNSLYLFKLRNNALDSKTAVAGTITSDTFSGNVNGVHNIPMGSDLTVMAEPNGLTFDLYGYSLDIINSSKDSMMEIGATDSIPYNSIVASGADVYSQWNDYKISDKLLADFTSWTKTMLDVDNYAAQIIVNYTSSSSEAYSSSGDDFNINTSISELTQGTNVAEDGVYPIEIAHGTINKESRGYKALINQISADYGVSYADAEVLFTDSGIYTSILKAIESDNDDFNKSGACSNTSWNLGNATNWYDETTRTFVVRRYTCLDNKFGTAIGQTKVDFGVKDYGNCYLNIYFCKPVMDLTQNDLYSGAVNYTNANNNHSMILYNTLINNTKFTTTGTTDGFNY